MSKLTDIELLAVLENFRLHRKAVCDDPDYIIRVCSAIVAKNAGYKSRVDWIEKAKEQRLIKYMPLDMVEEQAKEQYKILMNRLRGEN